MQPQREYQNLRLLHFRSGIFSLGEGLAFWLLVAIVAWSPFPLGSNRPWSWCLLVLLIALCWFIWSLSACAQPESLRPLKRITTPLIIALSVLLWAIFQTSTWVPASWAHPVWQLASDTVGRQLSASVSLAPWRTITEVMKLGAYVAAGTLTYMLCQSPERAQRFLTALMIVGLFYAGYALLLGLSGLNQQYVFYPGYSIGQIDGRFSGPFVSQNNFATYVGMAMLCACARLIDVGSRMLVTGRGARQFAMSAINFVFGAGAFPFVVFCFCFAMLVASGSRAGFISSLAGFAVLLMFVGIIAGRALSKGGALLGLIAVAIAMAGLFMITGDNLQARLNMLVDTGGIDGTRLLLWEAAMRMMADAPLLGLGLGTYEPAYPLYADRIMPFVMDKAHNDYLEFAAGIGLPAALAWWTGILWIISMCIRGVFIRQRNRHYPALALAATVLIGIHSLFDFSLQIPAIAVTYAVILGLGAAQSEPSKARATF